MASEGQAVRFRDCLCPGSPHNGEDGADDGDIVVLREHLGFAAGAEALRKMGESGGDTRLVAELVGPVYVREGPIGWNLVDESGPVPLTKEALEGLAFFEAYPIAEKADDLYSLEIMRPLAPRTNGHSANGRIAASTRQTTRSSSSRRSPRKPSSSNASGKSVGR